MFASILNLTALTCDPVHDAALDARFKRWMIAAAASVGLMLLGQMFHMPFAVDLGAAAAGITGAGAGYVALQRV